MGAYFKMGRASLEGDYVPRVGEVCMHEQPPPLPDRVVIGDGKTAAKDLPSLQPLDIYARVQRLEEDVRRLRNGAASGCGAAPQSYDESNEKRGFSDTTGAAPAVSVDRGLPRTFDTHEPVGWAVVQGGEWYHSICLDESVAMRLVNAANLAAEDPKNWSVTPLYRSPTLTDAEREAIEWFATFGNSHLAPLSNNWINHAATLRGLLERLG